MAEERKVTRRFKPVFVEESELPTHFVNVLNVRSGLEEFFLTIGTALPVEIEDIADLQNIDTIDARPVCRFAVTRTVMRQMIDLMESVYDQQTEQINLFHQSQDQEGGED
jgi:hypothetical protein